MFLELAGAGKILKICKILSKKGRKNDKNQFSGNRGELLRYQQGFGADCGVFWIDSQGKKLLAGPKLIHQIMEIKNMVTIREITVDDEIS